ncbi:CRISPR system precrRNA processing endoribonuclease RAMP protein Cas6 [Vibrio breoganii]
MITPALAEITQQFPVLKLQVTIKLLQDTQLPSFKGSMLHGWFGHALKAASEKAFYICYGDHDVRQPKPYMITPNGDHKTHWKNGECYSFEISLFGDATQLVDEIFTAIHIGEKMGLGAKRTPFKVLSIASVTANGLVAGVHPTPLYNYISHLQPTARNLAGQSTEFAFNCTTPLRLKHRGSILKQGQNSSSFWSNAALRRMVQLGQFWVNDNEGLYDALYSEFQVASKCDVSNELYFEDWQRFSLKESKQLPFGGLKGQVSFFGECAHLIPLFKCMEVLHLGSKTTFGLGKIELISGY